MKTIDEIIEEIETGIGVSLNYAFSHANREQRLNLVKNVAEKYAKQVAEAQREACENHLLIDWYDRPDRCPLVTDNI